VLKFTNNPWSLRPAQIGESLGLDRHILINDFAAVGHAIASLGSEHLAHVCGPDRAFGPDEVISIVGPGTGLGVAQILRREGRNHIVATEGGHIDFAPLDTLEDTLLARLRQLHDRVSVERILSGPGLVAIHDVLVAMEGRAVPAQDVQALWTLALEGSDSVAAAALDRFCMTLGSVAGDIALAQGGTAVVIAGGLGQRLASHLPLSGFVRRFAAKGRYEARMAGIPVRLVTHPQPGLYGAAAAYAREYPE
jgi:glucokinase